MKKSVPLAVIGLVTVVFGLLFFQASAGAEKQNPRPYKATTVDECIQEKACVWDAFSKQIGISNYVHFTVMGKEIRKWNGPLNFLATGENNQHMDLLYARVIQALGPFYPDGIQSEEPTGYLMVFTDDLEKTSKEWGEKLKSLPLGVARTRIKYNANNGYEEPCHSVAFSKQGESELARVISFIDVTSKSSYFCMASHFYAALGFWGWLPDQQFSFLSGKNVADFQFTKLDQFLVFLLYQPEFKSGQSFKDIKPAFDQAYERTRKNFLVYIRKNNHE